jgi:photosystem II stability/assembly factor-like uncharacterized protein
MKNFITTILILVSSQNLFAQSGWQWVNPSIPYAHYMRAVYFADPNTGWLWGGGSVKTTDGGISWNRTVYGIAGSVCWFVNPQVAYNAGGYISKTIDGGNYWQQMYYTGGSYSDICFINESTGVALNSYMGRVYTTTDGGASWNFQALSTSIRAARFFNSTTGFIFTAAGTLWKTTNSGVTFVSLASPSVPAYKAHFLNSTTGFAVGSEIWKSTDAGNSWVSKGTSNGFNVECITFTNNLNGYILSTSGQLQRTTNGGENWSSSFLPVTCVFETISFLNSSTGYAAGSQPPTLLKTTNGGTTWFNAYQRIISTTIPKVQALDASRTWVTNGTDKMFRTINGGTSWDSVNTGMANIKWFQFINNLTGWICDDVTNFKKTTDGGNTWNLYPIIGTLDVTNFTFINENTGWACCYQSGKIFKTTNGGVNWAVDYNQSGSHPSKIFFLNQITGWRIIGGSGIGTLQKTTNGGTNWVTLVSTPSLGTYFINESTGFMFGGYATPTTRTTNGGLNWSSVGPYYESINDMVFLDAQTGWGTGGGGGLRRTTNGGVNWSNISQGLDSMVSVSFSDINNGWAAGTNGVLIKTNSGGVVGVNNNLSSIPENILLSQNYPNPFNPSTRINYELRNTNYVTLKIFDLLGKEVAMLVNEKQNAGSYAVDFNSSGFNLPSGIYFYTLKTDGFTETKKMVLVK